MEKNKLDNYCVYMHVFPNDKKYIGLTKQNPNSRWGNNGSGYKDQPIYHYIQLYGWDSIEHYIIEDHLSCDEAAALEEEMIEYYNTTNEDYGYNIKSGGEVGGQSWCQFEYNGKLYDSNELASLSNQNISGHDITNRINSHGWDIDRAITQAKDMRTYTWLYNGEKCTTKQLQQIAKENGVDISLKELTCRLNRNWSVERAVTQKTNVKKQPFGIGERKYEYNGKMYNTYELSQMSPYDLSSFDIANRINHHGWDVERAINTPKKSHNRLYEYNGKLYKSTELCKLYPELGLSHNNITDRLRAGWSVEEAVETPKHN